MNYTEIKKMISIKENYVNESFTEKIEDPKDYFKVDDIYLGKLFGL